MSRVKSFLPIVLLFSALGALIYSNTFHAAFHYDDFSAFVANPVVHLNELSLEKIIDLFWLERPVSHLTFALNYYFGDLEVEGYHAVNITIHVITGITLYLFLYETLNIPSLKERYGQKAKWVALFSSLLWFSNPVQVQAITYVVQRMTSMAAMFYVLALLLYLRGRVSSGTRRWVYWSATTLSFMLSFGSKAIAITLPGIIAIYEVYLFQNKNIKTLIKNKFIYLMLPAIALLVGAVIYLSDISIAMLVGGFPLKERIYTESRVILYYITLLIFPLPERMSLSYDFPLSRTLFLPFTTLISLAILVVCFIYSVLNIQKRPLPSFFLMWFLITVFAEAMIVGLELVFEHRLYLPSMAFFPLLTMAGFWIWEKKKGIAEGLLVAIAVAVVSIYSINTYKRNSTWVDGYSIYADSARKYPNSLEARMNLGTYYLNEGMADKAIVQLEKAKELNPRKPDTRWYLGNSYYKKGDFNKAIEELERAVELGGKWLEVYGSLGDAYSLAGNLEKAEEAYRKVEEGASEGPLSDAARAALESIGKKKAERKKKGAR